MALYALSSLMATLTLEFTNPTRLTRDEETLLALFEMHRSLIRFMLEKSKRGVSRFDFGRSVNDAATYLEAEIRDFALKAEDEFEIKLSKVVFAPDIESKDEARVDLFRTLRRVTRDAEEWLRIITIDNEEDELDTVSCEVSQLKTQADSRLHRSPADTEMIGNYEIFSRAREVLLDRPGYCPNREVLAVVGMTGIGKTTLARRVYEDPLVTSYFEARAWVTMGAQGNLQEMLCDLLRSTKPGAEIDQEILCDIPQLKEQLYIQLKDKRYLIVLDDVWNARIYNDMQQCFPDDQRGSRVLLTTQFCDVANFSRSNFLWSMRFLDQQESWDLFRNRLSLDVNMPRKFERIARNVIEQCQGLPRAIVSIAKRLSKCDYDLRKWKKIEKEVDSLGVLYGDSLHLSKLNMNYNRLREYLKVCFLYFAVFPKNTEIRVEMLMKLWISEGFVKPFQSLPEERMARGYLDELISRSLVLITDRNSRDDIKSCKVHNALHSFCMREAQKEGLFCAVSTRQCLRQWSLNVFENSSRWLSLRSHSLDYYVLCSSNSPRSLFFFHGDPEMIVPFELLRVFDLGPSLISKRVPLNLGDLLFLRYLSVPQWFEGLDSIVSSNRNLLVLTISGDKSKLEAPTCHLRSMVWELPHIRHLELGRFYTVDPPSMVKWSLQTLSWSITISDSREEDYSMFPFLKKLKIFYKDVSEPGPRVIILKNIEHLSWLLTLSIFAPVGTIMFLEFPVFPVTLVKLRLNGTNVAAGALNVIGKLPLLRVLKLENAFYGRVWEVPEGGFRNLLYLLIEARSLEKWVASATHFPRLSCLVLRRCYCLGEIPRGFVDIEYLVAIELEDCRPSVISSAKWIQEEVGIRTFRIVTLSVNGLMHMSKMMEEFFAAESLQHRNPK